MGIDFLSDISLPFLLGLLTPLGAVCVLPLYPAFALISTAASAAVIGFLTKYRRAVNLVAGGIMLPISVYYLVFVFRIFGG